MNGVDLIPTTRRQARRIGRALRLWFASGSVLAAVVIASCVVAGAAAAGHDEVAGELEGAQGRVKTLQQTSDALRRNLVQMEVQRRAAIVANDQPDWSVLLRLVARNLDAQSSLRQVQLNETTPAPKPPAKQSLRTFETRLSGYCPTPAAVSAYVLRLQQLGLFNEVTLLRTTRQASGDVAFELVCTMGESMGVAR